MVTESVLGAAAGCSVREKVQGRPGREFLVPEGYIPPVEMNRLFELLAVEHPFQSRLIDLVRRQPAFSSAFVSKVV